VYGPVLGVLLNKVRTPKNRMHREGGGNNDGYIIPSSFEYARGIPLGTCTLHVPLFVGTSLNMRTRFIVLQDRFLIAESRLQLQENIPNLGRSIPYTQKVYTRYHIIQCMEVKTYGPIFGEPAGDH
jgi:hypothetical protein